MKFFITFIEVGDESKVMDILINFKKDLQKQEFCAVTVIDVEQSNYDFLYNSLIEKANIEKKRG